MRVRINNHIFNVTQKIKIDKQKKRGANFTPPLTTDELPPWIDERESLLDDPSTLGQECPRSDAAHKHLRIGTRRESRPRDETPDYWERRYFFHPLFCSIYALYARRSRRTDNQAAPRILIYPDPSLG